MKNAGFRPIASESCPERNPLRRSPPICIVVMDAVMLSLSHIKSHCNKIILQN